MDAIVLRIASVEALAAQAASRAGTAWLSDSECTRLHGITAPKRRDQFLAGRWALRCVLANELGGDAADWPLTADEGASPRLAYPPDNQAVHVALSHSAQWLACAIAPTPIGIDIEVPRRHRNIDRLLPAVCSPLEQRNIAACERESQEQRFYVLWTLKEAWLKRKGTGIYPGALAELDTQPSDDPATADARVWTGTEFTLALVATPGMPLRMHAAPAVAHTWWRISSSAP